MSRRLQSYPVHAHSNKSSALESWVDEMTLAFTEFGRTCRARRQESRNLRESRLRNNFDEAAVRERSAVLEAWTRAETAGLLASPNDLQIEYREALTSVNDLFNAMIDSYVSSCPIAGAEHDDAHSRLMEQRAIEREEKKRRKEELRRQRQEQDEARARESKLPKEVVAKEQVPQVQASEIEEPAKAINQVPSPATDNSSHDLSPKAVSSTTLKNAQKLAAETPVYSPIYLMRSPASKPATPQTSGKLTPVTLKSSPKTTPNSAVAERVEVRQDPVVEEKSGEAHQLDTIPGVSEQEVEYFAWAKPFMDDYRNTKTEALATIKGTKGLKNLSLKCKMTIRTRVSQVINQRTHICEMAKTIVNFVERASERGQCLKDYCFVLIAASFVRQSQSEVSVGMKRSTALAQMVHILVAMYGDTLRRKILGKIFLQCPHLIPIDMNRKPDESDRHYCRRLAYKTKTEADGSLRHETDLEYAERMSGIVALYAAILQNQSFVPGIRNAFGESWRYVAAVLNLPPGKQTPLLLKTFLEIAGHDFQAKYRRQARKAMEVLANDWLAWIKEEGEAIPWKAQLCIALERGGVLQGRNVDRLTFKPFPKSEIVNA